MNNNTIKFCSNDKCNYQDVSSLWIKNKTFNRSKVIKRNFYEYMGTKYYVDNKKVVFEHTKKEKKVAEWLSNTFGEIIYLNPKVNIPNGIQTADYIFKGEKFDLKEIKSGNKRAIDNAIKRKINQANNFIIDVTNGKLEDEDILFQIEKIFNSHNRRWVNIIIVKRNSKLIGVFKRKKNCPPPA